MRDRWQSTVCSAARVVGCIENLLVVAKILDNVPRCDLGAQPKVAALDKGALRRRATLGELQAELYLSRDGR